MNAQQTDDVCQLIYRQQQQQQHQHQQHNRQAENDHSSCCYSSAVASAFPLLDCSSSSWDYPLPPTSAEKIAAADIAAMTANANAGEAQPDFHPRSYVIAWLHHTFEAAGTASMTKEELFTDYLRLCESDDKAPLMASMFGKLVHRAFPGLRSSRLGARGQSKHCYKCFRRRLPQDQASMVAVTGVTSSRPPVPSTATSRPRSRSATYPLTGSRVKQESSDASLSSTILETVMSRSGEEARPKARTLSSSTSASTSTSTSSTSTRTTSPKPSLLASPLPHALRTVSPHPLIDINWSLLYQQHSEMRQQQQQSVKQEADLSPQFAYDSPSPSPSLHTSPIRRGGDAYRRRRVAHSRSALMHEHDEEMGRMTPPAYISPLEVDYFGMVDAMNPHEFNIGFCPSSPPQLSSIYSSPPLQSTSNPELGASTASAASSTTVALATPRSSVGDLEQFRTFLTRLAGESIGFDADLGGGSGSTSDLRLHYHRHAGVFGATAAIGQSGLWRPQVLTSMDCGQTAGTR